MSFLTGLGGAVPCLVPVHAVCPVPPLMPLLGSNLHARREREREREKEKKKRERDRGRRGGLEPKQEEESP